VFLSETTLIPRSLSFAVWGSPGRDGERKRLRVVSNPPSSGSKRDFSPLAVEKTEKLPLPSQSIGCGGGGGGGGPMVMSSAASSSSAVSGGVQHDSGQRDEALWRPDIRTTRSSTHPIAAHPTAATHLAMSTWEITILQYDIVFSVTPSREPV